MPDKCLTVRVPLTLLLVGTVALAACVPGPRLVTPTATDIAAGAIAVASPTAAPPTAVKGTPVVLVPTVPATPVPPTATAPPAIAEAGDLGILAVPPTATPLPPTRVSTATPVIVPTRVPPTAIPPVIQTFATDARRVDALELSQRAETVVLRWDVANRPAGSNLVFEQVFVGGAVRNVELPRYFTEVPSTGQGPVAPFLPTGDTTEITLQVRVVNTASGATLASARLNLPVANRPTGDAFVVYEAAQCYTDPFTASNGLAVGARGIVSQNVLAGLPVTAGSGIGGLNVGSLARGETVVVLEGPFCFQATAPPGTTYRQWRVRSELSGVEGWVTEVQGDRRHAEGYLWPFRGYVVYDAADCYSAPFLPDRGIRVGRGVRLVDDEYGITVYDDVETADGEMPVPGDMPPGEIFTVIDGPHCYRYEPAPAGYLLGRRQWQIRSEVSGVQGWAWEYSSEQYLILEAAVPDGGDDGGEPVEVEVVTFSAEPSTVAAGQPITITWEVRGVFGVSIFMRHRALERDSVPLNTGGELLAAAGTLTVSAPADVTSVDFSLFDPYNYDHVRTVTVACAHAWFAAGGPAEFCPSGPARTVQAAFQPFEHGWMIWHEGQIWTDGRYGDGIYPDTWSGGEVTYPEAPPEGLLLPARGFGTLWVNDGQVQESLGWATGPEQGYQMQIQQTAIIHRPGVRGGYDASDVLITLPDGGVRHAEVGGNGAWLSWRE